MATTRDEDGRSISVAGTTAALPGGGVVGPGDATEQTREAIRRIRAALEELGSGLEDVVRTRLHVTDISRWEEVGRAHGEFFAGHRPASTMVEVSALIDPALLVEVEADAVATQGPPAVDATSSPEHEPGPGPVIAAASPEDAGELLTLQRAAYATEAQIYNDPRLPPLIETLDELLAELGQATALKATAGHRIVGAVRAHLEGSLLHVGRLAVAPDWQGRGIGSRLLTEVERKHSDQADSATLFTGHLSTANLALYTRRGYREQRREELRPGVTLVHLVKALVG